MTISKFHLDQCWINKTFSKPFQREANHTAEKKDYEEEVYESQVMVLLCRSFTQVLYLFGTRYFKGPVCNMNTDSQAFKIATAV